MVVNIYYNGGCKFHQLAADQLQSGQAVYGPSIKYRITLAGSLSSSQPDEPPYWASPLALGLIDDNPMQPGTKNLATGYAHTFFF
jgi:hypothetical protein